MGFTYCTKKIDLGNSPLNFDVRQNLRRLVFFDNLTF
jgi:hypothetical protein